MKLRLMEENNQNIYEPIDEVEILGEKRDDNICESVDEIKIVGEEKVQSEKCDKNIFDFIPKNDTIDSTIDRDKDTESENGKYKKIKELKQQLENEKLKIKELIKTITQLEEEAKEESKN